MKFVDRQEELRLLRALFVPAVKPGVPIEQPEDLMVITAADIVGNLQ